MYPTRHFSENEFPRIGDIISMIPKSPFGAAIVVKVHDDGSCDLMRPYSFLSGRNLSTGYELIERVVVKGEYEVFTTGYSGHVDNRRFST